jgi:hypothetical protein
MSQPPTPLAPLVAGIAADMRAMAAQEAARAGLVALLHALIFATLARLLTTLESMVTLWAAGLLPVPAPRQAQAMRDRAARRTPRAVTPAPFATRRTARPSAAIPSPADPIVPSAPPVRARPRDVRTADRPWTVPPARLHPAVGSARHTSVCQNALAAALPRRVQNVTI